MELKRGYKQTEAGVIPVDWVAVSLGEVLAGRPDYGINAAAVSFQDGRPAYIRITDITSEGRFAPDKPASVVHPNVDQYYLRSGDIVFARTGATVGKSYMYDPLDGRLVFAGFLVRVSPDSAKADSRFIASCVQTRHFWNWVRQTSMRSGQPGINGKEYRELPLPLPPLPEQRAIATALSDVDALLAGLDKLIAKKRDLKQAAMQQLLTGKRRLPGFKGKWETNRVDEMGEVLAGKALAAHGPGRLRPYLRTKNVLDGRIDLEDVLKMPMTDPEFERFHVIDGDVLLNEGQSLDLVGRCSMYRCEGLSPYAMQNQLLRFRAGTQTSPAFAEHLFRRCQRSGVFASIATQTTSVAHLGTKRFSSLRLLAPGDVAEQTAIAAVLTDMDAEIAALEGRLSKTRLLKQGMMQELLTGRTRLV